MNLDEIDKKILLENFDIELINKLDNDNVIRIIRYLENNNIDYVKDLFLMFLDLFLLDSEEFIKRFERLKNKLGKDYVKKTEEDMSLIELMYE